MILNSSALSILRALHYTLKKIVPTQSTLSQAALSYYTDRAIIQLSTQRHQQPTRQLSNNIYASHHVLLHDSKKVGKQQLKNTTQHNTTQPDQGEWMRGERCYKNFEMWVTLVRRFMLLRVVDQQGIDVVSLYTKERLTQFRRQHVRYTVKLQWEMQPRCQKILKVFYDFQENDGSC
jgi:hypothetical protein